MTTDSKAVCGGGEATRFADLIESRWNALVGPALEGGSIGWKRRALCEEFGATVSAALASTAGAGAGDWQPIETAPSSGCQVIIFGGAWPKPEVVSADGEWWRLRKREGSPGVPTHWMPMPAAPNQSPAVPASPRSGAGEGEEAAAERRYAREVELQEIQDGAYGDGPMTRGLAREALKASWEASSPPAPAEHGVEIIKRLRAIAARGLDLDCQDFRTEDGEWIAASLWIDKAIAALSHGGGAGRSEKGEGGTLERVRHVKRGTEYEVLGEAEVQIATRCTCPDGPGNGVLPNSAIIREARPGYYAGDLLTVYRCVETGKLWCRFTDEFRDGRFLSLDKGGQNHG